MALKLLTVQNFKENIGTLCNRLFFVRVYSSALSRAWRVLIMLFLIGCTIRGYANTLEEYAVKTALAFNLAIFIEWPESVFKDTEQNLKLCVIGDNIVQDAFQSLAGKTVGTHNIDVSDIGHSRKISGCQIVFIGSQDRILLAQIHAAAANEPILTIDELNDYNTFRGIVNIQKVDGRMRLNINLELAQSAQLKISSRLLKLATIVTSSP